MSDEPTFNTALEILINKYSKENASNTPDFILANFLENCLAVFDSTMQDRARWYGSPDETLRPSNAPSSTPETTIREQLDEPFDKLAIAYQKDMLTSEFARLVIDAKSEIIAVFSRIAAEARPKDKELAPNGYSERVGYNQALEDYETNLRKKLQDK